MRKAPRVENEPWRRHLRQDRSSEGHRAVWKRDRQAGVRQARRQLAEHDDATRNGEGSGGTGAETL